MKNDEQYVNEVFKKYNNIKNTKEEKSYKKNILISPISTFFRIITIVLSCIVASGCVVYATNIIKENVFKKPKVVTYEESKKITEEEMQKILSEEEIKKIAYDELVNKFNKKPGNISSCELEKDTISNEVKYRILYDNKIDIQLNAFSGKVKSLSDWAIDDTTIPSTYSDSESEQIAKELYLSLGYKEGEYELHEFSRNQISDGTNLFMVDFCKKYGEIYNDYQCVRISFIPEVKQIVLYTLFDYEYDNNEEKITKDKAIEIAKNKSNELRANRDYYYQNRELKSVVAGLKINKMNEFVYMQENPLNEDKQPINSTEYVDINNSEVYVIEPKTRLTWNVELDYSNNDGFADTEIYYVDATTGEIIGGDATQ